MHLIKSSKRSHNLSIKRKSKKEREKSILQHLDRLKDILDNTLTEVATCERLIPLYKDNFEKNKTNVTWLKRAVSRLNQKDCTDNPIYPKWLKLM